MTTSVTTKTDEHTLGELPFPIVYVTDLLKAFEDALTEEDPDAARDAAKRLFG